MTALSCGVGVRCRWDIGVDHRSDSICVRGFLGPYPGPHFKGVSLGELGEIEPQHAHNIDRGAWLDDYGKEAKA